MTYENYRMYILVKEEYPPSVAINSAAHGSMGAYIAWNGELLQNNSRLSKKFLRKLD